MAGIGTSKAEIAHGRRYLGAGQAAVTQPETV